MFDMESRHIIEALRSGVPSRTVGRCFSEARPKIMREVSESLSRTAEEEISSGMVISGKYGEGKTHLLNTVFSMAHSQNMVVSWLTLSKETPMDKLYLVYQKIAAETYLPGHRQPGFFSELDQITAGSPLGQDLLLYCATRLQTDKLYYVLKAYFGTEDPEEKFQLLSDLEGDFIAPGTLKKMYRRIYNETARIKQPFSKTKNCGDYYFFLSYLFRRMGYSGWVILVDETELIGRLGKKARLKAYQNMAFFLMPQEELESTFSMFALSASYEEDVIEAKHEYENLAQVFPEAQEPARSILDIMCAAPQLLPLTRDEVMEVITRVMDYHAKAYDWTPSVTAETLMNASMSSGFLLRTRIRSAIEQLDQLYQYGDTGEITIGKLETDSYDVPELEMSQSDAKHE